MDLACKIFLLLETRSPTVKTVKGEPMFMSWKEIDRACGLKPGAARKLYERELPNIPAAIGKKIAAQIAAREKVQGSNSPRIARQLRALEAVAQVRKP